MFTNIIFIIVSSKNLYALRTCSKPSCFYFSWMSCTKLSCVLLLLVNSSCQPYTEQTFLESRSSIVLVCWFEFPLIQIYNVMILCWLSNFHVDYFNDDENTLDHRIIIFQVCDFFNVKWFSAEIKIDHYTSIQVHCTSIFTCGFRPHGAMVL